MKYLAIILLLAVVLFYSGKHIYYKGVDKGAGIALDTISTILDDQIKSDTSITKLVIINPDTSVYFISRKTFIKD